MLPTPDQIRLAAYHRWRQRGQGQGHDLDDWLAAEQHLLFALNYRALVPHGLDGMGVHYPGGPDRRVCRYCEQPAPRPSFSAPVPVLPESLGHTALRAWDECDECRALFAEALEGEFEAFSRPFLAVGAEGRPPAPS